MEAFVYTALPGRVVFGGGALRQLAAEVERLGARRVFVITTPHQQTDGEALGASLGSSFAALYSNATMHTPVEVTDDALTAARAAGADCLVALGGGSTIGLAKAIALRTDLPQIAIPTTYAGSEMTPILGETEGWQEDHPEILKVLPEVVIYDVDLTLTLPKGLSGTSGINAIAHSVEALYAEDANPIVGAARRAEHRGARPVAADDSGDAEATVKPAPMRNMAPSLPASCLGSVGMALHHKLCHTLGGLFDLPHSETHTIVLPHALAYNAPAVPKAVDKIARALGVEDAPAGISALSRMVGAPQSLRELGMPERGIDEATEWRCRTRTGTRGRWSGAASAN